MSTNPTRTSFQLPDLLTLTKPFELRTNRNCRFASTASENWFTGSQGGSTTNPNDTRTPSALLSAEECAVLHSIKPGLLAALCFPTCDAPQLRLLTDFLTVLICCHGRLARAQVLSDCGWFVEENEQGHEEGAGEAASGLESLSRHELFRHLVPRLTRLTTDANAAWQTRFTQYIHAYRSAQLQVIVNHSNGVVPDLETYFHLRRDASGWDIVLALLERVTGLKFQDLRPQHIEVLRKLQQTTNDIISWTLDVASFNTDQAHGNKNNLISVLTTHKHLSIQGAVNFAGSLIEQSLSTFHTLENTLIASPPSPTPVHIPTLRLLPPATRPTHGRSYSSPWSWTPFRRAVAPIPIPVPEASLDASQTRVSDPVSVVGGVMNGGGDGGDREDMEDVRTMVQGMKDCIVGCVNWVYETELFFGGKGEEVRAFGWVFLAPEVNGDA